ncbi:MAG: alkaline phosphatase family protein [Bacteroidetes bacterium]|nr:alkaline phosphatase family protein [Bacteroidota bacterium]
MFRKILVACFILTISSFTVAQEKLINSGPMVGYSTMREVMIWVQTTKQAAIKFKYNEKGSERYFYTSNYQTIKKEAFIAKIIVDNLEPGNVYEYVLCVDGTEILPEYRQEFQTQKLWQWREDPAEFTFATGSCAYINEPEYDRPGTPYGSDYQIFSAIYETTPDFMLWLGDNVYLREADWNSRSGIIKRYTHDRAIPEMQPMLGAMHHYAIWDDHDYGPDNSDRGFWNKKTTLEVFEMMWGNWSYGFNDQKCATSFFQWADCDFFLLDNRTFRTPDKRMNTKREFIGDAQMDWLIDGLVTSQAPFKFVVIGSQVLNPANNAESYSAFKEERAKLFELIHSEKIEGVVFLSGDVHRTELSRLNRKKAYPFYDFTISPLTSGITPKEMSKNPLLIEGTQLFKHNFAEIKISGKSKERKLTCRVIDSHGNEEWVYEITEDELKYK